MIRTMATAVGMAGLLQLKPGRMSMFNEREVLVDMRGEKTAPGRHIKT